MLQGLEQQLSGYEGQEVQASAPRRVAEASSSGRSHIAVSELSPDGKYLVLGDAGGLQILHLEASGRVPCREQQHVKIWRIEKREVLKETLLPA